MENKIPNQIKLLNFQLNFTKEEINSESKDAKSQIWENAHNQLLNSQILRNKKSALLSSPNDSIKEQAFRQTCLFYSENSINNPEFNEAYQEYVKSYHKITSLYLFYRDYENDESDEDSEDKINEVEKMSNLVIYDTESEKEIIIELKTPKALSTRTYITQLSDGGLFCLGTSYPVSGIALIIDNDYKVHRLPSGTLYEGSSVIYLNRNIYCFGGDDSNANVLALSHRFDLDKNRWFKLASMPKADLWCHSAIFNGNILISGWKNKNLLLYSVDIDSFSKIPYIFEKHKRKIVINAEERLYLVEFEGSIYESRDEYTWKWISSSEMYIVPDSVYWLYNKRGIYIGCIDDNDCTKDPETSYYKFSLDENRWIKLTPMPKSDQWCYSVIFNRKILISGWKNKNLFFYSIDIDSFSTIPYDFKKKAIKVLISAEQRLYLIQCLLRGGPIWENDIWESDIKNEYSWKYISSWYPFYFPDSLYWAYNKGSIYIGHMDTFDDEEYADKKYEKFNLNEKVLICLDEPQEK